MCVPRERNIISSRSTTALPALLTLLLVVPGAEHAGQCTGFRPCLAGIVKSLRQARQLMVHCLTVTGSGFGCGFGFGGCFFAAIFALHLGQRVGGLPRVVGLGNCLVQI